MRIISAGIAGRDAMRREFLTLGVVFALLLSGNVTGKERPVTEFAKLPPFGDISLSPDGSKAVALRAIQDTYHVVLLDFSGGKSRLLMAADPENFLFNWCRFANETRVICSIRSYGVLRAGQYQPGFRWYNEGRTIMTRLLAVDIDGENQMQLVPEAKTRARGDLVWNSPNQDDIISWLPDDPKHILMQIARDDRLRPSVYKLNIYTNKLRRTHRFLPSISSWYADEKGRVRFATGYRNFREPIAFSFETGTREEINLEHLAGLRQPYVLGMHEDDKSVYVIANLNSDTRGVHRVDLATGKVLETLWQDERYDAARYWVHNDLKQLLYAGYDEDGEHITWFNKDTEAHIAKIRAALGNPKFLNITSSTPNLSHLVVRVSGNGVDPAFYRYTASDQSLMLIAQDSQGSVVDFQRITYQSRDGKTIPAYLALPGPADQGPYPTIVDPHGGPWSESRGRSDFIAEFLINRGYAVLQPNFRGSTGYGDAYVRAGFGEWGGEMQNDVIDGLQWLIKQGIADQDRTCIYGGSYGGYVALVAAYKTPELFNCAISFAPVTDLQALNDTLHLFVLGHLTQARLPEGEELIKNSPVNNVGQFQIPLLLVHGDVDRSVFIEQSRTLVDKLREADKPHIYIEQTNGDHHFSLQSHRLEFLTAMDEFLKTHVPP